MAGKIIGREGSAAKNLENRLVQPTILLGLGGTGKEVLLRLRQRFFEKYGVAGFQTMRYLWLDTDVQNHNIDGKPLDHIASEVQFNNDEKICIEVPGPEFEAIFTRPAQNQHIFRWMDTSLKALGSVMNGARQIRLLGRLGFFHHAYKNADIRNCLGRARDQVRSLAVRTQIQDHYGIQVGDGLQVIIVCSLAGGTGSGIFLDTAFMVRDEFVAQNPDIVGYLVLPPVFSPDIHRAEPLYANAYAALKELEYYSMRKDLLQKELDRFERAEQRIISAHDFMVEWRAGTPKTIQGPPFNTCYLVNNETEGGGLIGPQDKTNLCDMIAENLFLDYSSLSFSAKKRSVRSNLDDYLTNELEYEYKDGKDAIHSEIFSFRYSAFGLSKIYVPVDRIRKACAFKLGTQLLSFWMKDNALEADPTRFIRNDVLPELRLRVGTGVDDIRDALWVADDQGQSFLRLIEDTWQGSERAVLRQKLAAKQRDLVSEFERRLKAYAENMLAMPREREKWGHFVKRLYNANKVKWLDEVKGRLLTLMRRWMNNPHFRAQATLGYLRELNRILKEHSDYFQRSSERADKAAKESFARVRQYQDIMTEEERGKWLHGWSLNELIDLLCRTALDHFRHRAMSLVYRVATECCEELREIIGEQTVRKQPGKEDEIMRRGKMQEIWSIQDKLGELQDIMAANLHSFEHIESHLIFENLYEQGMFEHYYKLQKSADHVVTIDEEELKQLEDRFRGRLEILSLFDLKDKFEDPGFDKVCEALSDFCIEQFRNLKLEIDAILTLYKRYQEKPNRINDIVQRFARNGRVWLRKSAVAGTDNAIIENYAEDLELGIYQRNKDHSNYEDFLRKAREHIGALRGPQNAPLDVEQEAVYLYNEYAGLPLMYIARIEQYRDAYLSQLVKHKRTLHIDREEDKFNDILIKQPEEVQDTIRINKALLVGAILRVVDISVNKEDGQMTYRYQDRQSFPPRTVPLGNQYLAVENLRQNKELLRQIERDIQNAHKGFTNDDVRRQKLFTALSYHTIGNDFENQDIPPGPFAPRWIRVGKTHLQKFDPEHRAIATMIAAEQQAILARMDGNEEALQNMFLTQYQTLDSFTEKVQITGREQPMRILRKELVGRAG